MENNHGASEMMTQGSFFRLVNIKGGRHDRERNFDMTLRRCFGLALLIICLAARGADTNDPPSRLLAPNDTISVTVYQEDDLSAKTSIDTNGMVMLPLLGQVKIGAMTVGQATARIQELYKKDYLVNPRVNLMVEHFAARRFSVLGEVQRPGSFDFPANEPVNLLQAIAMSGGYTRLGAPAKVSVRRVENGTPKIYRLDAGQMAEDGSHKPFEVLAEDIITVGQRNF